MKSRLLPTLFCLLVLTINGCAPQYEAVRNPQSETKQMDPALRPDTRSAESSRVYLETYEFLGFYDRAQVRPKSPLHPLYLYKGQRGRYYEVWKFEWTDPSRANSRAPRLIRTTVYRLDSRNTGCIRFPRKGFAPQ